jgi:ATP-dependent DNA ligase
VAEWLRSGLQNRLPRFNSGRGLHNLAIVVLLRVNQTSTEALRYGRAIHRPMLRRRSLALEPCLPRPANEPPAGPGWIHEIKRDGFRILARHEAERIRLFTRHGTNFTHRFPLIVAALESLPVRSCVIDGEAIVVDGRGLSVFDVLRYRFATMPPSYARST